MNSSKSLNPLRTSFFADAFLVSAFWLVAYVIYRSYDPSSFLDNDINPWDSAHYKLLFEQFLDKDHGTIIGEKPFVYRYIHPLISAVVSSVLHLNYAKSSHFVNLVCSYVIGIFSFFFWRFAGVKKSLAYLGLIYSFLMWNGPLRTSIYYPGSQYPFEVILFILVFMGFYIILRRPNKLWIFGSSLLFAASFCRENIFYCTLLVSITLIFKQCFASKSIHLTKTSRLILFRAIFPSMVATLIARGLVIGVGNYNIFLTILIFGWFHLNLGEIWYMYFYAFGPFALLVFVGATIRIFSRSSMNFCRLGRSRAICSLLTRSLLISSFIFAFVGGTDSDRFLLWTYPFFFCLGLLEFQFILQRALSHFRKTSLFALWILTALLSSRTFVPAIPNLIFVSGIRNQAYVVTNINPDLYVGPGFLRAFRNPVIKLPKQFLLTSPWIPSGSKLQEPYVSLNSILPPKKDPNSKENSDVASFYKNTYKLGVNNIPFPLGFLHNQFELLSIHPSHGDFKLRFCLLAQWIFLYLVMCFMIL